MIDKARSIREGLASLAVELESTAAAGCPAGMSDDTFDLLRSSMNKIRSEIEVLRFTVLMAETAFTEAEY